jgi:hypothetical protein
MHNSSEQGWLVSIVTRLWAGRSVMRISIWVRVFSHLQKLRDKLWSPPTLLFNEHRGPFPRIKRQGRDNAYLPLRTRLSISGIILLFPLYTLMAGQGQLYRSLYLSRGMHNCRSFGLAFLYELKRVQRTCNYSRQTVTWKTYCLMPTYQVNKLEWTNLSFRSKFYFVSLLYH